MGGQTVSLGPGHSVHRSRCWSLWSVYGNCNYWGIGCIDINIHLYIVLLPPPFCLSLPLPLSLSYDRGLVGMTLLENSLAMLFTLLVLEPQG